MCHIFFNVAIDTYCYQVDLTCTLSKMIRYQIGANAKGVEIFLSSKVLSVALSW